MKNSSNKVLYLAQAAMIAAIYVVLTVVGASLAFGEVQIRFAEALTILPVFTPAAIPGLFVGCLIGNTLGGAILPDIIFGSLATLIGAIFTWSLRNKSKFLAPVPPVVANIIVVPFVLKYAYMVPLPIPFMMLTVGVGEVISAGVLGLILYGALNKYQGIIFKKLYRFFLCNLKTTGSSFELLKNLSFLFHFLVTVQSQPPKCYAFRRCGVSAK